MHIYDMGDLERCICNRGYMIYVTMVYIIHTLHNRCALMEGSMMSWKIVRRASSSPHEAATALLAAFRTPLPCEARLRRPKVGSLCAWRGLWLRFDARVQVQDKQSGGE